VAEYGEPLSERELEILQEVATGATNRGVAYKLNISPNTVKVHLRNIYTKLGAESRTEATMTAVQRGWITVPPGVVLPDEEAEPRPRPPLPLSRRLTLVVAALIAVTATAVAWPRTARSGPSSGGPLPAFLNPEPAAAPSVGEALNWAERAQMPTRRAGLALAAWGKRLVAIGGASPDGVTGAVEIYHTEEDTWDHGADKPTPVAYVGAGLVGDRIYVPGGCTADGGATARVEVYDPQGDRWSETTPLPIPVCAYALAVHDGQLYVFGGTDGQRILGTVFAFDPETERWDERTQMAGPRTVAAAATLRGRIYLVGGYRDGRELTTCSVYDPEGDQWDRCAAMTVGRNGLGLAALGEQLYAVGGGSYLGFNERYDPQRDQWQAIDTPLTGVWRSPGVALIDLTIYAVGGWSDNYVGLNLAFDPLPIRIFLPVTEG
jgi:DNA-binding CsgD family transcriptional regulator/N-acetylneuraminic acid mutarotase